MWTRSRCGEYPSSFSSSSPSPSLPPPPSPSFHVSTKASPSNAHATYPRHHPHPPHHHNHDRVHFSMISPSSISCVRLLSIEGVTPVVVFSHFPASCKVSYRSSYFTIFLPLGLSPASPLLGRTFLTSFVGGVKVKPKGGGLG